MAYVYGPAQEDSSVECLRHTYLMSKEQFVNDILCKVMDEHTLILGDLNLKLNSNDDPINKSKAENLATKVMEEKNFLDTCLIGHQHG